MYVRTHKPNLHKHDSYKNCVLLGDLIERRCIETKKEREREIRRVLPNRRAKAFFSTVQPGSSIKRNFTHSVQLPRVGNDFSYVLLSLVSWPCISVARSKPNGWKLDERFERTRRVGGRGKKEATRCLTGKPRNGKTAASFSLPAPNSQNASHGYGTRDYA